MSVERKYDIKTHTVKEKVMVSEKRYCDKCGKEIIDHHWRVNTYHFDWGNDSCESNEYNDYCSVECLRKAFEEYVEDSNDDMNTCHFKVEHKPYSDVKGDIEYV